MESVASPATPAKKRTGLIAGILIAVLACLCLLAGLVAGVVLLFKSDALSFSSKWQQYTNSEKRFRMSYPNGWVYEESSNSVTFASSQDVLDEGPGAGGSVSAVIYLPSSLLPSSPAELIQFFANSREWENTKIVGQVSESKVSGYPAASAELSSFDQMEGIAYHMTITAVLTPEMYYVIVGAATEDEWLKYKAILHRIANSLEILTP